MTTQEERKLRAKLETDIRTLIGKYESETGYCVADIIDNYETVYMQKDAERPIFFHHINIRIN